MDEAIPENLSQKIDSLIEKTTQEVVLPDGVKVALEDAAHAVAEAAVVLTASSQHGRNITASVMKLARVKKLKAMTAAFDDNTLAQLVGMAIESNISDDGDNRYVFSELIRGYSDVPAKVEQAARDYETAAQKVLVDMAGDKGASEAMDNDAPYYMWMTQEGHGVGIDDGKLDDIAGLDLAALRKLLDTDSTLRAAHGNLEDAINNASFEILSDAYEEIVGNANDVFNEAVEAATDVEKERDPSDYFPDGPGDDFAYQWGDVDKFVKRNLDSHYLEDVAEVCSKALADGISGEEIEKAMYDVGDYKLIPGFRAMKNCVVSSSNIGDVELFIATNLDVANPHGKDITLKDVGEMMGTRLGSDVSVKTDFDAKEAASGEIKVIANIDGYVGFFVDPNKLATKLGVK